MHKISIEKIVIRFSGDSGDGIQLLGNQFSESSILISANDIYTFVDFPPEIRAPAGSIVGVSSFQLAISSKKLYAVDDEIDILIAFNPAALKVSLIKLKKSGIIIIDIDTFNDKNLKRAGFEKNPLLDDYLKNYKTIKISLTKLTYECVKFLIDSVSTAKRCKNFFILGIICWLFNRTTENIILWLQKKFKKDKQLYEANRLALLAGFNYADTIELLPYTIVIPSFKNTTTTSIKLSGNKAFVLGAITSSLLFDLPLFSANYPITPASDILHELTLYANDNIKIIQLEDEIASINAVLGASYGGALSFTSTSGPGLDLMQEGIGLSIMAKLPTVILNIQRCGPSTGIPTKSEQTDLLASVFGRHGESRIIVLAPNSPSSCFWCIIEAFCLAISYLGPIIVLSDANLANSCELWEPPDLTEIKNIIKFDFERLKAKNINISNSFDYLNSWIVPGNNNFQICIGGLERDDKSNVSHDPDNHQKMVLQRNEILLDVTKLYAKLNIEGQLVGDILLITWGSSYGIVKTLYNTLHNSINQSVSLLCINYIYPLHTDIKKIIYNFKILLVIEENLSQLALILKAEYLLPINSINQISGNPFNLNYLTSQIINIINSNNE
ncbi:MAG TPA: 2-oxoacid:acceptor oxidoreductase subunit alpha [Candidatus Azoamicus sp. OHIO2]